MFFILVTTGNKKIRGITDYILREIRDCFGLRAVKNRPQEEKFVLMFVFINYTVIQVLEDLAVFD